MVLNFSYVCRALRGILSVPGLSSFERLANVQPMVTDVDVSGADQGMVGGEL